MRVRENETVQIIRQSMSISIYMKIDVFIAFNLSRSIVLIFKCLYIPLGCVENDMTTTGKCEIQLPTYIPH